MFIDHMGPAELMDYQNLDVPPHPHIGLSTLTFLFEGAVMHRDSLGTELEILPGAVNWMTAGKGVVHSERTPERLRASDKKLHGLQIWVALPKHLEDGDPSFAHIEAADIPQWKHGNVNFKLVAGKAMGKESPVPVHSPLYMIEIQSDEAADIDIGSHLFGESGLYILEGGIESDGHMYGPRQILIAKDASLCSFRILPGSKVYIFGGEPFPEERYIYWNFVHSNKETIEKAKEDWQGRRFPLVPGDDGYVPLPESRARLK